MSRHTIVKVCGITRPEDAEVAAEAGADWLGFILWTGSPRGTTLEMAAHVLRTVGDVVGVAVLVNPTPEEAIEQATAIGASRVQLHQVNAGTWPVDFPLPVTFAMGVEPDGTLQGTVPRESDLLMLDTARVGLVGGTGATFPWSIAARHAAQRPLLLAGGLHAGNVVHALEVVRPFGVDSASRLEHEPGTKDPDAVRSFVAAVREWDERTRTAT